MKGLVITWCVMVLLALPTAAQTVKSAAVDLGWLAGCWQLRDGKSVTDEQWMKPLGGMLLGISRTVRDGKAVWYENTRIVEDGESLAFVARPSGVEKDTSFKLVKRNAKEWTFENAGNDFPQRIIYRSLASDAFFARIEGTMNGKAESTDFNYKRVSCK